MGLRVISIKIEEDIVELLDIYAKKLKMTRSEIIRNAIEEMLSKNMNIDDNIEKEEIEKIEFKKLKIYT